MLRMVLIPLRMAPLLSRDLCLFVPGWKRIPNEPSASRETILESDSEHVSWGDTPTPTDFGEIPIALGSAAAPTLRQALSAPGAQPDPQRDSSNSVDVNQYDARNPGQEVEDMVPTSYRGAEHSSLMRAAHRMVAWEKPEEGRAEISRRRLADDNAQNPGRVNGFYDPLAEEEEHSEGSPEDDSNRGVPAQRPAGLSINDLNALAGLSINDVMRAPFDSDSVGFQSQITHSPTEERETIADGEHDEVQSAVEDLPTEEKETAEDSDHDDLYE
jgi:hypothetical protein